jgi:peroxiredoxin
MALVNSKELPLGSPMPEFRLKDTAGKSHAGSAALGKKGLLIAFTCNHCPYAKAIWPRLIELAKNAAELGVNTIGINSNIHPDYPEDAPEKMKLKIGEWGIPFPYLVDDTQDVAKTFDAQCTPDLYLYDAKGFLAYHGRLDDNWKDVGKVKRQELFDAVKAVAGGLPVAMPQHPSMGCSIKWR